MSQYSDSRRLSDKTGLYYVSSRYYDPEIGRWINADGLVDNRGLNTQNMFQYCGNNPVMNADPSGQLFGLIVVGVLAVGSIVSLSGCSSKPAPTPSTSAPSKPAPSTPAPSAPEPSKPSPSIPQGGKSVHKGSIAICTDGSDGKKVPDANWQPYTALSKWTDTTVTTLDAYTMPYVVMPVSTGARQGASLGDKALVINWDTGQSVWCIVGDIGPAWGEVSINVIWTIDNPNHMTANHASGLSSNYEIILYPGSSFGYDWSYGYRKVNR